MRVGMMLYAGFRLLEVSGPMAVFGEANRLCGQTLYEQHLVGLSPGPVVCSNGAAVVTTEALTQGHGSFDVVLIPGSPSVGAGQEHPELVTWLKQIGRDARRLASVSNGAFLLARAGLADHRWLTTHPDDARRLASEYPLVHVMTDLSCLKDGNPYSAGGVRAGIRLALTLVQEDLGDNIVGRIAETLLIQ